MPQFEISPQPSPRPVLNSAAAFFQSKSHSAPPQQLQQQEQPQQKQEQSKEKPARWVYKDDESESDSGTGEEGYSTCSSSDSENSDSGEDMPETPRVSNGDNQAFVQAYSGIGGPSSLIGSSCGMQVGKAGNTGRPLKVNTATAPAFAKPVNKKALVPFFVFLSF